MEIVIIDDHTLFGDSLKQMLFSSGFIGEIGVFQDGASFIAVVDPISPPDIIILDLILPQINGMELLDRFQVLFAEVKPKVLVLSALNDAQTVKQAMRGGARGYLSKSAPASELLEAIAAINQGELYVEQGLKDRVLQGLFTEQSIMYMLSPREKEVLKGICTGATIKEIAYSMKLSPNTVQSYHRNLMKKVKVNRTADLIVYAMQHGLYIPNIG